jgi:hypothetical protein
MLLRCCKNELRCSPQRIQEPSSAPSTLTFRARNCTNASRMHALLKLQSRKYAR